MIIKLSLSGGDFFIGVKSFDANIATVAKFLLTGKKLESTSSMFHETHIYVYVSLGTLTDILNDETVEIEWEFNHTGL